MTLEPNSIFSELNAISLSDLLDQLEIDLSHLGQGDRTRSEKMLIRMDVVGQKIQSLAESNIPVTAESAQFEYIQHSLEKSSRSFLKDVGGSHHLTELREKVRPTEKQTWWFIELTIERQRRNTLRSIGVTLGITAFIVLIFAIIFNTILKPDPIVVARYTHQTNAEQFLAKNDPSNALVEMNEALKLGPDASLFIMRGVIENLLGQKDNAMADFASAEAIVGDRNTFLLERIGIWLRVTQIENAKLDIEEVLRNDAESAQANFFYGKTLELSNDYYGAIIAYQKASDLAEKQGKAELNATIRMTMAMLMQSIPPETSATRKPTP